MVISDNTQMFRDSATALTADADSSAVQIPGGNLHTPMFARVDYYDAKTSSGAGTVVFSVKRCATSGGSYTEHVDGTSYTVVTGTAAKKGTFYLPICHADDYSKVGLVLTGTGKSVIYHASLVASQAGG